MNADEFAGRVQAAYDRHQRTEGGIQAHENITAAVTELNARRDAEDRRLATQRAMGEQAYLAGPHGRSRPHAFPAAWASSNGSVVGRAVVTRVRGLL